MTCAITGMEHYAYLWDIMGSRGDQWLNHGKMTSCTELSTEVHPFQGDVFPGISGFQRIIPFHPQKLLTDQDLNIYQNLESRLWFCETKTGQVKKR